VVVHIDDFWGPHIAEWDWDRFEAQVAAPLRAGRPAHYQRWNWDADAGAEWHDVAPGRVVVVEGVSATRAEVSVPWAVRVWVEAPRDVRLRRALERDGPRLVTRWLEDWMPSEEAYIARDAPAARADLVVDGAVEPPAGPRGDA
jgi:uridine kinase